MSDDQARDYIEKLLWPDGEPVCRHCGSVNAYRMQGASCRPGLCRCRDCKKQFTVTVGTIFEDSHIKLNVWVMAIHLMTSSKKGISALQLQRNLGLGSYRTAWFMAHRVRLAMKCDPVSGLLKGAVQVDETYVGGKPRNRKSPANRTSTKTPVMAAVETGDEGRVVCQPVTNTNSQTLRSFILPHVDKTAVLVTDELRTYRPIGRLYAGHQTVNHSIEEYVNRAGYTTNTAEGFFALLKRGHYGTFHQLSKQHLHRYCDEFAFRWNARRMTDADRRDAALMQVEGKRLMYRKPTGH